LFVCLFVDKPVVMWNPVIVRAQLGPEIMPTPSTLHQHPMPNTGVLSWCERGNKQTNKQTQNAPAVLQNVRPHCELHVKRCVWSKALAAAHARVAIAFGDHQSVKLGKDCLPNRLHLWQIPTKHVT
jgi:hypothetical protein